MTGRGDHRGSRASRASVGGAIATLIASIAVAACASPPATGSPPPDPRPKPAGNARQARDETPPAGPRGSLRSLGLAALARAWREWDAGRSDLAGAAEAIRLFEEACLQAPDDPTLGAELAWALCLVAEHRIDAGPPALAELARAAILLEAAVVSRPADVELRWRLGHVTIELAQAERVSGAGGREGNSPMSAHLEWVLDRDARHPGALCDRARIRLAAALWDSDQEDVRSAATAAVADLDRSLAAQPGHARALALRALGRSSLASADSQPGGDGAALWELAELDAVRATELGPTRAHSWRMLAQVRHAWARATRPGSALAVRLAEGEVEAWSRAIALDQDPASPTMSRGIAWHLLGSILDARGEDPVAAFRQAIADFDMVAAQWNTWARPLVERGRVWCSLAGSQRDNGQEWDEPLRAAQSDALRAIEIDSQHSAAWELRALLVERRAAWAADDRPAEAATTWRAAIAGLIEVLPAGRTPVALASGRCCVRLGETCEARRESGASSYARATELFGAVLAIDPTSFDALRGRGEARVRLLRTVDPGLAARRVELARGAVADLERAGARDPADSWITYWLGHAHLEWADALSADDAERRAHFEAAHRTFVRLLRAMPEWDRHLAQPIARCRAALRD